MSRLLFSVLMVSAVLARPAFALTVEDIEPTLDEQARAELKQLILENSALDDEKQKTANRSPAIDGPATDRPTGQNAHLYTNEDQR
jgi:hypothetical protein